MNMRFMMVTVLDLIHSHPAFPGSSHARQPTSPRIVPFPLWLIEVPTTSYRLLRRLDVKLKAAITIAINIINAKTINSI